MSRKIIELDDFGMYCCTGYDEDSLNLLIYHFLLKIKDEPCLKIALRFCERDYGASYDDVKEVLVENNYIRHDFTKDSWITYGMNLSLVEIKEIASELNLKNYGRKKDVLIRIYENADVNDIEADYYFLTDEGLNFIDEHDYIKFYIRFLSYSFRFSTYERHYLENGQNPSALFEFFKMHENIAVKENDIKHMVCSFKGYSQACIYYDRHDGLYEALYEYCLRINNPKLQLFGERIDLDNADAIIELSKQYSQAEFCELFEKAFENIEKTEFSKKFIFESLKELLKTEDPFYVEDVLFK